MIDLGEIRYPASKLEVVDVGKSFAMHSPASGSIVLTNMLGRAVLDEILYGNGPGGLAEDEAKAISAIVDDWKNAGLFDDRPRPFPRPPLEVREAITQAVSYRSAKGQFSVETDSRKLTRELDEILFSYSDDAGEVGPAKTFRCVADKSGQLALSFQGKPIWSRTDRDEARFLLLKEAAQALCGESEVGAVLHGSAVSGPSGKVLAFIGESGQGKSTLSLGLVANGCHSLADDHIPLACDGRSVLAFPTAAAVKSTAYNLPEIRQLFGRFEHHKSTRDGVTYIHLPTGSPAGASKPISAVIVPQYMASTKPGLERVSPEEAFATCIRSGARPCRASPQISSISTLCNTVPFYLLKFSSSSQSIPICLDLLAK